MSVINSLTDADGDLFLSSGSEDLSKLLQSGWSYSASLFDSYNAKSAAPVYRLSNQELDSLYYTTSQGELASRLAQGWVNEGKAFKAADKAAPGLTPIHQLYRESDHTYLYAFDDDLIGEMTQNGFSDEGAAWYSPVNDGTFRITKHNFDPLTGKLTIKYSLDELQLSQFRDSVNQISVRACHVDRDGQLNAQDIKATKLNFGKIDKKTGNTSGTVMFNVYKTFKTRKIDDLTLTLNSKYGRTDAAESLFGLVRTTAVHLSGVRLKDMKIENSSDLEELGYENLFDISRAAVDPGPGGYYDEVTISERDLRGADWSNARFLHGLIYKNNLSGAKLENTSFEVAKEKVFGKETSYASRVYGNDMSFANLNHMKYTIAPGLGNWNIGQNVISGYTGKLDFPLDPAFLAFNIEPTRITILNQGNQDMQVYMATPQYFLNQAIKPGQSVVLIGTAYDKWDSKPFLGGFSGGRDDVYASIWNSRGDNAGLFSALNSVLPAHFYVNGERQLDSGQFSFASWEFVNDVASGYKNWTITVR